MALEVERLKKVIEFKKGSKVIQLDYPEGMTPAEAVAMHGKVHSELTTAKVEGPKIKDGKAVYIASTNVGTKG